MYCSFCKLGSAWSHSGNSVCCCLLGCHDIFVMVAFTAAARQWQNSQWVDKPTRLTSQLTNESKRQLRLTRQTSRWGQSQWRQWGRWANDFTRPTNWWGQWCNGQHDQSINKLFKNYPYLHIVQLEQTEVILIALPYYSKAATGRLVSFGLSSSRC